MAMKTENIKQSHDGANEGSGGHLTCKEPCKRCQFKRKSRGGSHCITDRRQVMMMLQSFAVNRFDICIPLFLAITPEKDMFVHKFPCGQ